jgi:myo-inositol-1(or 4)-monophosphatase
MSTDPKVETLAIDIAAAIRDAVAPSLGDPAARERVGIAPGGDVTMAIDDLAEHVLHRMCTDAGDIAFYSEDQGYVEFGTPRAIFVVDPIDGTRPAAAGLESCCVSVAVVPPSLDATLGDVELGFVHEIKSGRAFVARRGEGYPGALSSNTDLGALFWTAGLRCRPALETTMVLQDLIDGCSMRGGYFDLGSCTFNMTRIVTGQLDAYVDLGQHLVDTIPGLVEKFRAIADGAVGVNWPYDVAAATLILQEAGGVVTRPDGGSIADHPAVGSGDGFGLAIIASASPALHELLVGAVATGMTRLAP